MKYWFYSEGNILGPYSPAELLSLPAFGQGTLVCPETCTGDNPGDWKAAEQVGEIAEALSVGVGGIVSAQSGGLGATYELETGFSSNRSYYEAKNDQPYGYENLLNTIDNILGTYKEPETSVAAKAEPDYELMDRFDIRLSKIQEDLEAARWEKNLLMEKIRARDSEERKNRERITELEGKLKEALSKGELQDKELSQVQHLTELDAKSETIKKISEIKKEDFVDRAIRPEPLRLEPVRDESALPPVASAAPVIESRTFKSIRPSQEISLERMASAGDMEEKKEHSLTSRKLKSLGSTVPSFGVSGKEQPGSMPAEAAPRVVSETMVPLPQQASGMVYDFTVVTSQPSESEKVRFKIEPKSEPAPVPQPQQVPPQPVPKPSAQPQSAWESAQQLDSNSQAKLKDDPQPRPSTQPAPQEPQTQNVWQAARLDAQKPAFITQVQAQTEAALLSAESAFHAPVSAQNDAAIGDKTERISIASQKQKYEVNKNIQPAKKGRSKMAFLATLMVFGSIAAGGLGYFFLGAGSFSEFSMLNFKGDKSKKASFSTQVEPQADKPQAAASESEETGPDAQGQSAQEEKPAADTPAKPASESASNENTSRALEIVKNYKLSGGRGSVAGWFANSFLSNSASGSNEAWTATILHGDIFVVEYRLLRPKQDPLIYQFEVDVVKGIIVRGINNDATELLDFSSKATAKAEPARPKVRKAAPKARNSREIPILPLPDEPAAKPVQEEPTGFETANPEDNEKVKYIVAQESDEELF